MFEKEYELSGGKKITIKVPKQRQMQNIYTKAGVGFDANNDNKVIIKDLQKFNFELVKASTGMSDDEIGDLYEVEYREIAKIVSALMKPKQEEVDFLPQSSQEI